MNGGTVIKTNDNQRCAPPPSPYAPRACTSLLASWALLSSSPPPSSRARALTAPRCVRVHVSYATNSESGFVVREVARMAGAAVQEFMVKNDCPCGTTIGPIISSRTGLRTVDVGVPSLSMHSIRETMGVHDVDNSYQLFRSFFRSFAELDGKCDFVCRPCAPTDD